MAGQGTSMLCREMWPRRSRLSLGPARGGSELTPPWTLRLSLGQGPVSQPFLLCGLFFTVPSRHHSLNWVWVQEAPPRGREAGKLRVCLCTFLGLSKGRLSSARARQPGRQPLLAPGSRLPEGAWPSTAPPPAAAPSDSQSDSHLRRTLCAQALAVCGRRQADVIPQHISDLSWP